MLGGKTITERTREHAREMLVSARSAGGAATAPSIRSASSGKGRPRAGSGRAGSARDR
jgi:hypothetical protein